MSECFECQQFSVLAHRKSSPRKCARRDPFIDSFECGAESSILIRSRVCERCMAMSYRTRPGKEKKRR